MKMLASFGARTLRVFVRLSQRVVQRRDAFSCWTTTILHQTSLVRQTFPRVFINSLCTEVEAEGTERLSVVSNDFCEAVEGDGDGDGGVKSQEISSCTDGSHKNYVQDIQNSQKESLYFVERDSSSRTSNTYSSNTAVTVDPDAKDKDFESTNSKDCISESYPFVHLSRFELASDWKQKKGTSPGIKFPGDIYVIKNYNDELKHKEILEQFLAEGVLGFDTEHCPIEHLVCVIQLASQDKAVLWQCMNFKRKIPRYLKEILTGKVTKVGHACLDDAIMIFKQFNIEPVNLIDTNGWARDLQCSHQSLQGLCGIFLGTFLSKKHQQSNWKKTHLSPGQIRYAATDAWISLRVYQEMKRHAEELDVNLTPMYKTLQEWYTEVKDNKRKRRRRRRQRLKERKQIEHKNVNETSGRKIKGVKDVMTTGQIVVYETLDKKTALVSELEENVHGNIAIQVSSDNSSQLSSNVLNNQGSSVKKGVSEDSKKSKGSRRRKKQFLAKFHPLE